MGAPLAWPHVFSAFALAVDADPELRRGTHLRLVPSGALGFPLAPFMVFEGRTLRGDAPLLWSDAHGRAAQSTALDAGGGRLTGVLDTRSDPADVVTVALEVLETGGAQVQAMRLVDASLERTVVARTRKRWLLAAPAPHRLVVEGRGGTFTALRYVVGLEQLLGALDAPPAALLGLPLDGDFPWYVHRDGRSASDARVLDGAPLVLSRPDRPDGPFDPLTPDAEGARVGVHADSLAAEAKQLVSDERVPPWEQQSGGTRGPTAQVRRLQTVSLPLQGALLTKGLDAGFGRFLGLAGRVDRLPPQDGAPPPAWVAVGIWAVDPRRRVRARLKLGDVLGPVHELEARLISRAVQLFPPLERLVGRHRERGLDVRALLTVAAAVPPPDAPRPAQVGQVRAQWLPAAGGPSTHFQAMFTLPDAPLSAQLAVGRRRTDGTWETTHVTDPMPAGVSPPVRARPRLLGRMRPDLTQAASTPALVSESPVAEQSPPQRYRFAVADLFGRFGPPVELEAQAPARPAPPMPAPQVQVLRRPDVPAGDAPASPGDLQVRVQVPKREELALGTRALASLVLMLDAETRTLPVPAAGGLVETTLALPALGPQERRAPDHQPLTLLARFVDAAGTSSAQAEVPLRVADARPPKVISSALGIIWTSRPGPAPEVELALRWPGRDGEHYRVYMTDARTVLGDAQPASRAAAARLGGEKGRAGQVRERTGFRLITEPPLVTVGGTVTLDARLPRSLETVQFLRILPVNAVDVEAPFPGELVAVAVPQDRRPPAPRLTGTYDAASGKVQLVIEALGLDLARLEAEEPGLFGGGAQGRAPEVRLRRAGGLTPDAGSPRGALVSPLYARVLESTSLVLTEVDGVRTFRATVEDGPLVPFVRYAYWAEVRMPPERRVDPGADVEVPPPGGVQPALPTQAQDCARPFSASSTPLLLVPAPPGTPEALPPEAVSVTLEDAAPDSHLTVTLTGGPRTHAKALGPYVARVWPQWGDEPLGTPQDVPLTGEMVVFQTGTRPQAGRPESARVRIALVDPLGRVGASTTFSTPA